MKTAKGPRGASKKQKEKTERLDALLLRRELVSSLEEARALILRGSVVINHVVVSKAGARVPSNAEIVVRRGPQFVSRGGYKLVAALQEFAVSPQGKVCADVGCSTGGFTDVLLQSGAAKVYAIDIGYGDLAWNLRQNPRVVVMERKNAMSIEALPEPINLVSVDVSLLTLTKVLPNVRRWLAPEGEIVALVKPQYEARPEELPEGAVITDPTVHCAILERFLSWAAEQGFGPQSLTSSPILGKGGNREFLVWLKPGLEPAPRLSEHIAAVVASTLH